MIALLFSFFLLESLLPMDGDDGIKIYVQESLSPVEDANKMLCKMYEGLILNESSENYYTWIDFSEVFVKDEVDKNSRYLFKPFQDYSLVQLLCEDVVFLDGFNPVVGISFLKRIAPGSSFKYNVDCRICKELEKHIFYVSETDFKRICGTILNEAHILFSEKEIYITLSAFTKQE